MRWITLPEGADPETQLHFAAVLAVHASLMPTGEILYFGGDEHDRELWRKGRTDPSGVDHTRLFNCATLEVEEFNPHSPTSDVFCCGHAMLTDGRLLVVGGTEVFAEEDPGIHHQHMPGLKDSWIYDPFSRTWIRVSPLNEFPQFINRKNPGDTGGRWYPTVVTLSDGLRLQVIPANTILVTTVISRSGLFRARPRRVYGSDWQNQELISRQTTTPGCTREHTYCLMAWSSARRRWATSPRVTSSTR